MKDKMVEVEHFKMSFGRKSVIEDLSFEVQRGEIFGFLGANGSGKTTTLRALLDIYSPTGGTLTINGSRFNPAMTSILGYLPEERGLYSKEKVLDVMAYFGQLKGLSRTDARNKSLQYLQQVGLADKAQSKLNKLSGGQQQKIQLGVTIINDPELLILDEPTKGLDPVNRTLLMNIIDDHHKKGATIMMVTHQMDEVERLCDRVMLLKDGKRRLYGSVGDVKNAFGQAVLVIRFEGKFPANPKLYTIVKTQPRYVELQPAEGVSSSEILQYLVRQKLVISQFEKRQSSLEDIFVTIYNEGVNNER